MYANYFLHVDCFQEENQTLLHVKKKKNFFFLIGKKKYIQKTARCKLAPAKQKYKNMENK